MAKAYVLYRQQRADVRWLNKIIGVQDDLKLSINAIKVLERRYLLKDEAGNASPFFVSNWSAIIVPCLLVPSFPG